jgi:hypothetical protein
MSLSGHVPGNPLPKNNGQRSLFFMPADKQTANTSNRGQPLTTRDQRGQKRAKAAYRKPLLRRLGVLRSAAGSEDPHWGHV